MNYKKKWRTTVQWLENVKHKAIEKLRTALAETSESDTLSLTFRAELSKVNSILRGNYFKYLDNPDEIMRDKMSGRGYAGYDRMVEQDSHLGAVIQTREQCVASLEWDIIPYTEPGQENPSTKDQAIADNLKWIIQDLDNINEIIKKAFGAAMVHGVSYQELLLDKWKEFIIVKDTYSWFPSHFRFNVDNQLEFSPNTYSGWQLVEPYQVMVYTFNPKFENKYGTSLCKTCYWAHWFKTTLIKYMMTFSERLGQPAIIGKYPRNWGETLRDELYNNLKSMKNDSVFAIPEDAAIELLEAKFRSEGLFRETIEFWNDEISKRVLGQTLTTGEGRRSGSLALGEVHNEVREDLLSADAKNVSIAITNGLIKPLAYANYGYNIMVPKFRLITKASTDLVKESEVVKNLHSIGIDLSKTELYERFGYSSPDSEDDSLKGSQGLTIPQSSGFAFAESFKPKVTVNGKPVYTTDITILESIYDNMAEYIKSIYSAIESELLITISPGMPIAGLIDQVIRRNINQEFLDKISGYSGDALYGAIRGMTQKLKTTLADTTFEAIKNSYLQNRFYEKGVLNGMADTLRNIITNTVPDWTAPGINFDIDEMKKLIRANFKDLKDYRVNLIARNEIAEAANHANFSVLEKTGYGSKMEAYFLVDPQSCDICQEWASKNPYPVDVARSMGLPHIQCNDQWSFVFKEGGNING